ncbi:MAG: hypothetical protein ACKOWW_02935 [Flavobacteriales bacterium]
MAGRPRIGTRHNVIVPDSEWDAWVASATKAGLTVSEWLRQAGAKACEQSHAIDRPRKSHTKSRR